MTREEARDLLPIITAYTDGKPVQYFSNNGVWKDCIAPSFDVRVKYRIKPEDKYKPFKTKEECWEEMKKHEPFAWLKDKEDGHYLIISSLDDDNISINSHEDWDFAGLMREFTFADGKPFGIEQL